MKNVLKSLSSNALRLVIVGTLVLFGTWASAEEDPPPVVPQTTETQPAEAEVPETPAEPEPVQETRPARVYRSAWEITVDGKAESNGVLSFVIEPNGGTATLVKINVLAKSKKKDIAKDVAKQMTFAFGATHKIKASGDKVKIKANKKLPPFYLGIETQAVNGVSVRLKKG